MPMAWYPISTRLGVSGKTPWGRLNKSGEVLAKDNIRQKRWTRLLRLDNLLTMFTRCGDGFYDHPHEQGYSLDRAASQLTCETVAPDTSQNVRSPPRCQPRPSGRRWRRRRAEMRR